VTFKLPWVGWYTPDGNSHLSTWSGKTRHVIVTNVPPSWHPANGLPDGAEVLEVSERPTTDKIRIASSLHGLVVIVFDTFPVQPKQVRP
jgi:hypothetical protein